jgi:hypothetical protein
VRRADKAAGSNARGFVARVFCSHLTQEGALFRQDELVLLGKREIRDAVGVSAQSGAVGLIGCQIWKRDQAKCDVVRSFMGHPIALQHRIWE